MPEKRRTRTTGGQVKVQRTTTQTTLKDLFQRSNSGTGPTGKAQDLPLEHIDPVTQVADPHPPARPPQPPKSSQLFPIFTKATSVPERFRDTVISVEDPEVIDITDTSSEMGSSTAPFTRQLPSPRSEPGHATSHSPSPSPIVPDVRCCERDTTLPHVDTHEPTHSRETSKRKGPRKRTLELGDVAPLPSSCSQHVRGVQRSYTCGQAPRKRSVFPNLCAPDEGTLDFLATWRQLDDVPSTPSDHIHRSLTPQQCEEHLRSLSSDYVESHPAFARICLHRERIPLYQAETWTRRFRPRCANEVLGNEQHAIYLRDWLSALGLRLRDRQPEEPASKGATAREKGSSKRVEPRGVKRPRIVRAVDKKRGNKKRRVDSDDDLDDFVVFSDVDEEPADEPPEDSDEELAFCQRTLTRLHRCDTTSAHNATPIASSVPATEQNHTTSSSQEPVQTNFADHLTNTLLITGPPGCGKTAAVYACAEELGWEVFEVYPGIGRRNGANLDHLVGDVGKNHIVQTSHKRAPTKTTRLEAQERVGLRGYLAKSKTGTEGRPINVEADSPTHELQALPPDQEMVSPDEAGISGMHHAESDGSRPIVGQSLVLLEEVDVLFKEDAGFWPAVIDFIQGCQRPVVMTCNDPGLVPLGDLPLQKVLVFGPCPSTVAASFLQCLSLAEGCLVPHEDLMVLYETTHGMDGLDIPDAPLYPRTEPLPLPDLRRSITQLQMLCAGARHGSTSEMHPGDEAEGHVRRSARPISAESRVTPMGGTAESDWWRQMKSESELMSHVDAELRRSPVATGETLSTGREEEEMGYVVVSTGREGLVYEQRDELIAEEAIRHSRGVHEEDATGPIEVSINPAREGFRARVEYQSRMVDALQDVVGPPAPLVPQRSVFLDYIPWVRHMVAVEDALERGAWDGAGRGRGGRWTRNSMRTRHTRTVGGGEGRRALLRESGLE